MSTIRYDLGFEDPNDPISMAVKERSATGSYLAVVPKSNTKQPNQVIWDLSYKEGLLEPTIKKLKEDPIA